MLNWIFHDFILIERYPIKQIEISVLEDLTFFSTKIMMKVGPQAIICINEIFKYQE